jgi:hypothetical protein
MQAVALGTVLILAAAETQAAGVACRRYELREKLPKTFSLVGEGHLAQRRGAPGTMDNIVLMSNGRCACDNYQVILHDRGERPPPDGRWSCRPATPNEMPPSRRGGRGSHNG